MRRAGDKPGRRPTPPDPDRSPHRARVPDRPARDALAAAVELADLLHELLNGDEDDWADRHADIREHLRGIDRGAAVLAAILDAHQAAAKPS